MPTIWEVNVRDFIGETLTVAKRARDRKAPIIVTDVGAVVQMIRGEELWKVEKLPGMRILELSEVARFKEEQLKSFVVENRAAYLGDEDKRVYACLVSFDALEVIKKTNPKWASRWWWDRSYGCWWP